MYMRICGYVGYVCICEDGDAVLVDEEEVEVEVEVEVRIVKLSKVHHSTGGIKYIL